jgi:hypothetical protein
MDEKLTILLACTDRQVITSGSRNILGTMPSSASAHG